MVPSPTNLVYVNRLTSLFIPGSVLRSTRIGVFNSFMNFATSEETKAAEQFINSTAPESETSQNEKKLSSEVQALTNEINELKLKNNELLDKYKRSLADGENLRVRLTKQIQDAKLYGIQGFCKDLLEVADILGHATNSVPKEQISDKNPHLKNLYEGLVMTQASLMQVFKRHGVQAINPINQKFDPNLHEAVFQKESKDAQPNTVIEVSKVGYKLNERCIRPAIVGVSKSA